jgi:hypothetical protein
MLAHLAQTTCVCVNLIFVALYFNQLFINLKGVIVYFHCEIVNLVL